MWQQMLVLLALSLRQFGGAEVADGDSFVQDVSQLMSVQKCCPQAQMMVEVASANGPKFLCQVQNDSFNWAPDYLDAKDNLHSFSSNKTDGNNTFLHSELSGDSYLCAADNGPCILPITGKPQCGPVFQSYLISISYNPTESYVYRLFSQPVTIVINNQWNYNSIHSDLINGYFSNEILQ